MRILARLSLPAPKTRYAARLLTITETLLAVDDSDAQSAALEAIVRMARRPEYADRIGQLQPRMNEIARKTDQLEVFGAVLRVITGLRLKPAFGVREIGQRLINRAQNSELAGTVRKLIDEVAKQRRGGEIV
jgi:hypothetical protein